MGLAKIALILCLGAGCLDGWTEGRAVRYGPTVMLRVARVRGIPPVDCMVAWTYAKDEDMGRTWLLVEGVKTGVRKRCEVIDLPQPRDRSNLIKRGIVVEIDYKSSRQICPPGWDGAARLCAVRVKVVE